MRSDDSRSGELSSDIELQDDSTIEIDFAGHPGDEVELRVEPVTSSTAG
jgi:hypothetical protein